MTLSHDTLTEITAIIPQVENPEVHLRNSEGRYPTTQHERGEGTFEEALHKLGRKATGMFVGVNRRAPEAETGQGHIVYHTKPVPANTELPPGYSWHAAENASA
jgi:hypothetical protein